MKKFFALLLVAAAGGGCAPADHNFKEEGAFDPVEPINRAVYGFNQKADFFIMRPAAKIYDNFPPGGKILLRNLYSHLGEPKNIVNHVLQKRGDDAVRSTARLVYNTVLGGLGATDFAGEMMGIKRKKNDFGRTIRAYAGNRGAYVVLPLLGPSSVADAPGRAADGFLSPQFYLHSDSARVGVGAVQAARARAELLDDEELIELALDEYSFVRDAAEEWRRRGIPSDVWGKPAQVHRK